MDWRAILDSGQDRLTLPTPIFLVIASIPCLLQWKIATAPCNRLSTRIKQCLSVPTMMACLIVPVMLAGHHAALTIVMQLNAFNTVLRCLEPIFIAPAMYGVPAQLNASDLRAQLWSCLRRKSTNVKSGRRVSRYHLLVPIALAMFLSNLIASWYATFSGEDALAITRDQQYSLLFFAFFAFAALFLTLVINTFGYMLQLIYLLMHGEQDYQPDEWRPLMDHPVVATSLNDLWSCRWHQLFRAIWLVVPFRPMCTMVNRILRRRAEPPAQDGDIGKTRASSAGAAAATISVFFVSGLMHEYIVYCQVGRPAYVQHHLMGQECLFFTLQGVGCILEQAVWRWPPISKKPEARWARKLFGHVWVTAVLFLSFPWFLNGFAYFAVWHANPFNLLTPFLLDHVWRRYPILRSVCGSLL